MCQVRREAGLPADQEDLLGLGGGNLSHGGLAIGLQPKILTLPIRLRGGEEPEGISNDPVVTSRNAGHGKRWARIPRTAWWDRIFTFGERKPLRCSMEVFSHLGGCPNPYAEYLHHREDLRGPVGNLLRAKSCMTGHGHSRPPDFAGMRRNNLI